MTSSVHGEARRKCLLSEIPIEIQSKQYTFRSIIRATISICLEIELISHPTKIQNHLSEAYIQKGEIHTYVSSERSSISLCASSSAIVRHNIIFQFHSFLCVLRFF